MFTATEKSGNKEWQEPVIRLFVTGKNHSRRLGRVKPERPTRICVIHNKNIAEQCISRMLYHILNTHRDTHGSNDSCMGENL